MSNGRLHAWLECGHSVELEHEAKQAECYHWGCEGMQAVVSIERPAPTRLA